MKKRTIAGFLMIALVFMMASGCYSNPATPSTPAPTGGSTTGPSGSPAVPGGTAAPANAKKAIEPYTGEDIFEAIEHMRTQCPDAKAIRYVNSTSTAAFKSLGGAIPMMVFHLAKELPIRTEGRYRIDLYPDGQLASGATEAIAGVQNGAFEMNSLVAGNWGEYTDAFAEVNVPFLIKSYEISEKLLLDEGLQEEMFKRAEQDVNGIKFIGINTLGFRQITNSKREIKTPADVKGLKLRVMTDPIQVATFEALGASVVSLAYSELFTAMQQGVVDGEENPAYNIYNDKFYEVQDYMSKTNHIYSPSCQYINKAFFEAMSPADQKALEEIVSEGQRLGLKRISELEDYYYDVCIEAGMQVTDLSEAELQPFQDILVKTVYPKSKDIMGQERWDRLMAKVEQVEKDLGLR